VTDFVKALIGAEVTGVESPTPLTRVLTDYVNLNLYEKVHAALREAFGDEIHDVSVAVVDAGASKLRLLCRASLLDRESPHFFEHDLELEVDLRSGAVTG
jgi:hypothetical protein